MQKIAINKPSSEGRIQRMPLVNPILNEKVLYFIVNAMLLMAFSTAC